MLIFNDLVLLQEAFPTAEIWNKLSVSVVGNPKYEFDLSKFGPNDKSKLDMLTKWNKITSDDVRKWPDLPWNWLLLSEICDEELYISNRDKGWYMMELIRRLPLRLFTEAELLNDVYSIAFNPECTGEIINKYGNSEVWIIFSSKAPLSYIIKNPKSELFQWNYYSMSKNREITEEYVLNHPSDEWNYDSLSDMPNISWDFIYNHRHLLKTWTYVSMRSFVTVPLIRAHPDIKWDWIGITATWRHGLGEIMNNLDLPWDNGWILISSSITRPDLDYWMAKLGPDHPVFNSLLESDMATWRDFTRIRPSVLQIWSSQKFNSGPKQMRLRWAAYYGHRWLVATRKAIKARKAVRAALFDCCLHEMMMRVRDAKAGTLRSS